MKNSWLFVTILVILKAPCHHSAAVDTTHSPDHLSSPLSDLGLFSDLVISAGQGSPDRQDNSSCTITSCGGTENITLYNQIGKYFRQVFYQPRDIFQLNCKANPNKCQIETEKAKKVNGLNDQFFLASASTLSYPDFDRCCQSYRSFGFINGTQTTVDGTQCSVITYNNAYQIVNVGTCETSSSTGCTGTCRQENTMVTLLCICSGQLQLNFFEIPSYCSCKAN